MFFSLFIKPIPRLKYVILQIISLFLSPTNIPFCFECYYRQQICPFDSLIRPDLPWFALNIVGDFLLSGILYSFIFTPSQHWDMFLIQLHIDSRFSYHSWLVFDSFDENFVNHCNDKNWVLRLHEMPYATPRTINMLLNLKDQIMHETEPTPVDA